MLYSETNWRGLINVVKKYDKHFVKPKKITLKNSTFKLIITHNYKDIKFKMYVYKYLDIKRLKTIENIIKGEYNGISSRDNA